MAGHNEKFMTNYEEQLTNNLDKKKPQKVVKPLPVPSPKDACRFPVSSHGALFW